MSNLIIDAITAGGGYSRVGKAAGVAASTVHRWGQYGMPESEWLPEDHRGRTYYCEAILECIKKTNAYNQANFKSTRKALLDASLAIQDEYENG